MLTSLKELLAIVSGQLRRRFYGIEIHAVISAAIDASAFALLYPLLKLFTAKDKATAVTGVTKTIGQLLGTTQASALELRLGILIVGAFIASTIVGLFLVRRQCRLVADTEVDISAHLFDLYVRSAYLEHVSRNSAQMIRNTNNIPADIASNGVLGYLVLTQNVFTAVFLLAVLCAVSPAVVGLSTIYFGLGIFIYGRTASPRAKEAGLAAVKQNRVVIQSLQEGFSGIKAVIAANAVDAVSDEYRDRRARLGSFRYLMVLFQQLPQYYLQGVMIGGVVLFSIVVALLHVQNVTALLGIIIAASIRLLPTLYTSLNSVSRIRSVQSSISEVHREMIRMTKGGRRMRRGLGGWRRSDVEHGEKSGVPDRARGEALRPQESIVLDEVTFRYPNSERDALKRVSVRIPCGAFVGVVGPSGAGKTTLVDLLLGLFVPDTGSILVDDIRIDGNRIAEWRDAIGYVPQDVFLLDASVTENIALGVAAEDIDEDRVWEALDRAHVGDVIRRLPAGLGTELGERGVRLSGGQRQRLGIARALYRSPSVLILDEATSALDTVTEAAVARTVEELDGRLTRIVIAHRLSTVRRCDWLLLLENGEVSGAGPFEVLRRESAVFGELANMATIE